jgi:L-fucose isomerase-like protein
MSPPKIGFVTCVHPLYDLPAVAAWREEAAAALRRSGCEVILSPIPRTAADAAAIAADLVGREADLVVLYFCSWVSEEVTLALARAIGPIPLLLWALPYLDRDIPMPSPMSGLTASGSNIRRMGKRFAYVVGGVNDATVWQVARAARAAAAVTALRRARLGVVGEICPGMVDVQTDEAAIVKALGVTIVHFDLDSLVGAAEAAPRAVAAGGARRLLATIGGPKEVGEADLADNLRLWVAIHDLVRANRLDAYCVRCWPELRNQTGMTACASHSLMAMDGIPSTCEVDVPALITTWLLARLADAPAFNFDLTAYLGEEDALQFAHCGAAAPALAADPAQISLRRHMRTGTGATVEFPFPAGRVTLAKLLRPGPEPPHLRLFAAPGEVVSSGTARGSVATVRPEPSMQQFLSAMMAHAVEHHLALVYGDWQRDLELFCEFTGIEYFTPAARSVAAG